MHNMKLVEAKETLDTVIKNIVDNNIDITRNEMALDELMQAAQTAGYYAATEYDSENDWYPCGFAWIALQHYKDKRVNGASKIGKMLEKYGADKHYGVTGLVLWNPARSSTQSMYALRSGAYIIMSALEQVGFDGYVDTRID